MNSEGIPRKQLMAALRHIPTVLTARKINACLLCRRGGVNEAGLCDVCYGQLNEDEQPLAHRWLTGVGP